MFEQQENPLVQAIRGETPWLVGELGFHVAYFEYSPRSFGNCIVDLNGPQLRLRLVKDRGQILAYVASLSQPEEWLGLDLLLEAIHRKRPPKFELYAVVDRIRENLPALVDAIGPRIEETRLAQAKIFEQRLLAYRQAASQAFRPTPRWVRWFRRIYHALAG